MFLPVKMGELWPSCAEYRASCAEYRASCGRVVRVLGELFGKIVEFGQLAQKRLGRHLCLGGGGKGRGMDARKVSRNNQRCTYFLQYFQMSKQKKKLCISWGVFFFSIALFVN